MKTTGILLTGVGGQGIILISKILTIGLADMGFEVKMSEIHGMSQRGGTEYAEVRAESLLPTIGGRGRYESRLKSPGSARALP